MTVRAGYDALGPAFAEWTARIEGDPWEPFVDGLAGRRVLDLGCGPGRVARRLAGRSEVVGVDLSEEQLRLARERAPEATFLQGDFTELDFPESSFGAVVALNSFVHVPRDGHGELFTRIARWLEPGGLFLASLSNVGGPDRTERWLGVDMFFSGWDEATNRRLLCEAGFELLVDRVVFMREPEYGEIGFHWVLARA